MRTQILTLCVLSLCLYNCSNNSTSSNDKDATDESTNANDTLRFADEKHLKNIKQLTFGGDNAEAYWSFASDQLVFQSNNPDWNVQCDQIFVMDPFVVSKQQRTPHMVSTGKGRTTCSYFMPGDSTILYASTHLGGDNCPEEPHRSPTGKYVWPIYNTYDIFVAGLDGNIRSQLTIRSGYDAEATVSPKGDKIVFTSDRSGDLELYVMDIDGSNVVQVTDELGYDGGAFFSPDGSQLVFRASRPQSDEEIKVYKELLAQGLVQPTQMEIFVCDVDGSNLRQVTNLGGANWAPFFHPSGEKILFSSNHSAERGFKFNLFMVNLDGSGLEQITYDETFDSFPMFSFDGKYLVFSSNRNNKGTRDTNVFLAEWVD